MSIKVMSQVWEDFEVGRSEMLTLLTLANFANEESECWPGLETIAAYSRQSQRNVIRQLLSLQKQGKISIKVGGARPGDTNRYKILSRVTSGVQSNHPKGDKNGGVRVTKKSKRGDTGVPQMSSDPSGSLRDPSVLDPSVPKEGSEKKDLKGDNQGTKLSVPSDLSTTEVEEAWELWKKHRKEIKKPLTPTSATQQLNQLRKWGPQKWVDAVKFSIGKSWQGIFEDRSSVNGNGNGSRSRHFQEVDAQREDRRAREFPEQLTARRLL